MVNRPKNIGTAAETAVVRAARQRGFPMADRLTQTGAKDRGDIGLCPGVILEVKGGKAAETASDALIGRWLVETARERVNAGARHAFLVTKRAGVGGPNAHLWWAHLTLPDLACLIGVPVPTNARFRLSLDHLLRILREEGYGDKP